MKNTIHYALILDQSGSMQSLKQEVISSYNEQVDAIKKLKKSNPDSEIKFTLCIFNDEIEFKFISQDIARMRKIKPDDYQPDSCTALYDAMGITITKIRDHLKPGDQVFIAIFTDGLENASTDFSAGDIRKLLVQADENGWTVRFFCRYEDSVYYKKKLDIADTNILNISLNEAGLKVMESEICDCLSYMVKTKNQ
jgi:hypothetical protein